ncbi:SIP/FAR complex WD repeat (scaffold) subunit, striatin, Far8/Csc3 [Schizosaccharomyces osmophilus]|uniref:SIP/FAR complex WD repeat (Scaffold) subunit, striatin, Far8/Csc3 n=1 Tax=Schizosaccharomyces osmophilus TaxID=2545709 RepID=A0AAE9W7F7_9SCHI|nr:SIP/FAR complex WD repeat (scaffold) subunit, striatin, Far8/Csc3 [Schizosaccharomyces osmophilus]WBW70825.1 SIP/FAR complex WD repeat (scaffold) subunit, striatin, Far8/Csc3 [Schizosaccharomyces osmophilus]
MKSLHPYKREDENLEDGNPNMYTLQGVIQYLQYEAFKNERDKNIWEIEKAELKVRIASLEREKARLEQTNSFQERRNEMLEKTLNQVYKNKNVSVDKVYPLMPDFNATGTTESKSDACLRKSRDFIKKSLQEVVYLTNLQPNIRWNSLQEQTDSQEKNLSTFNSENNAQDSFLKKEVILNDATDEDFTPNDNSNKPLSDDMISDDLLEDEIMTPALPSSGDPYSAKTPKVIKRSSANTSLSDALNASQDALTQLDINEEFHFNDNSIEEHDNWKLSYEIINSAEITRCITHEPLPGSTPSFASGTDDGIIYIWTLSEKPSERIVSELSPHLSFYGHKGPVLSLCVPKATHHIFSGGHDGTIRCWKLPAISSNEPSSIPMTEATVFSGHDDCVWELLCLEKKEKNPILLSLSSDNTVRGWKYTGEQLLQILKHNKQPLSMCLVGDQLAIAWNDGFVRLYEVETQEQVDEFLIAGDSTLGDPAIKDRINRIVAKQEPNPCLYSLHENGILRVHDLKKKECICEKSVDNFALTGISFVPHASQLAVISAVGNIHVYSQDDCLSPISGPYNSKNNLTGNDNFDILWLNNSVNDKQFLVIGGKERIQAYSRSLI